MSAIGWQARLNEASSAEGVVNVCREYVGLWTSDEIAQLPATCRPRDDLDSQDLNPYALKLIQFVGVGDRASVPMLYKLSTFFTKAALRLEQVTPAVGDVFQQQGSSRPRSSE
jgi:hypothetical protein